MKQKLHFRLKAFSCVLILKAVVDSSNRWEEDTNEEANLLMYIQTKEHWATAADLTVSETSHTHMLCFSHCCNYNTSHQTKTMTPNRWLVGQRRPMACLFMASKLWLSFPCQPCTSLSALASLCFHLQSCLLRLDEGSMFQVHSWRLMLVSSQEGSVDSVGEYWPASPTEYSQGVKTTPTHPIL